MYERIAVIIKGHVRTWHYIKHINFHFYESISKNIDYYFVTWDLPYDHNAIINDFKDKNLIKYLAVEKNLEFYNALTGPSWLAYNILPYKKEREKEVTYDAVFDLRPDVIFVRPTDNEILPVEPNSVYVQWVTELNLNDKTKEYGIDDLRGIMNSDVYEVFCQRHKFQDHLDPNISLKRFYDKNNIKTIPCNNYISFFIRPTVIEYLNSINFKNPMPLLGTVWDFSMDWKNLSDDRKLDLLNKYNILLEDFSVKKYD